MLLVIHNLPSNTRYADVKSLIQTKCGLTDVILDNLVNEGACFKKVTVGLADEGDAAILVRKINGLYLQGQQLYVEDVRKQKSSEQPYRSSSALLNESSVGNFGADPKYQDNRQDQGLYGQGYQTQQLVQNPMMSSSMMQEQMSLMMNNMMSGMMYMPTMAAGLGMMQAGNTAGASTYMSYGTHSQDGVAGQAYPALQKTGEFARNFDVNASRFQDSGPRSSSGRNWPSNEQGQVKSRWDVTSKDMEVRGRSPPSWNANRETMEPRNQRAPEKIQTNKDNRNRYFDLNQGNRDGDRSSGGVSSRPIYDDIPTRSQLYDQEKNMSRAPYDQGQGASRAPLDRRQSPPRALRSQGVSAPRPPFNQSNNLPRSAYGENRPGGQGNAIRPASDQGRNVRPPFDGGKSRPYDQVRMARPTPDQGKSGYSEDKDMSRPPRPETRRQQEQPRGYKRGLDPQPHGQTPSKKFAGTKPPGFDRSQVPPPGQAARDWKPNPQFNPNHKEFPKPSLSANFNKNIEIMTPELKKLRNKDETFRGQGASHIAKEVVTNLQLKITNSDPVFKHLKTTARERINTIFGDKLVRQLDEVILAYRNRFHKASDAKLYRIALQKAKTLKSAGVLNDKEGEMVETAAQNFPNKNPGQAKPGPSKTTPNKPAPFKPADAKPTPSKPAPKKDAQGKPVDKKPVLKPKAKPAAKPAGPSGNNTSNKLVPNADKLTRKLLKKQKAEELMGEISYDLPPLEQKALDEEADILCDLFMGECMNPDKENEKKICEIISDNAADVFRKVIRLQVTKRILNITAGLQARVMFYRHGLPPPKPASLDRFFASHGIDSVYKAKRAKMPMYLVTCKSFEVFDRLCYTNDAVVDGITMQIKPFQIIGPPLKGKKKLEQIQKNTRIHSQIADELGPFLTPKKKKGNENYNDDVEVTNFDDNATNFASDSAPDYIPLNSSVKKEGKVDKGKVQGEAKKSDKVMDDVKNVKMENVTAKTDVSNEKKVDSTTEDASASENKEKTDDANKAGDKNEAKDVSNADQNESAEDWPVETGDDWPVPEDAGEDWTDANDGEDNAAIENADDIDVNEDELEDY